MILGMSIAAFTQFHVILSLIGIASGVVVLLGMLNARSVPNTTALFLITTVLTSATGFLFPSKFGPAHVIGVISLVVLAVAILALWVYKLVGPWRWIYVASAVLSLYLNAFVGVVQTFQKVPFFHALAPTQAAPPFAIAQGLLLVIFIALGIVAAKRFRPAGPTHALGGA
jgi:hypothetical protein